MSDINQLKKLIFGKIPKSFSRLITSNLPVHQFVLAEQQRLGTRSIAETVFCLIHNTQPTLCSCGNLALFNTYVKGYREVCSVKCKHILQSQKLSAFWQNNPSALSKIIEKQKQVCLEKYGITNIIQLLEIKEKIKQTNLARYGAESPLQLTAIKNKIKEKCLENLE